jgi:hypothetical protein
MSAPATSDSIGSPRSRPEHRQARTAAGKRLAAAQRELHQLSRQVQLDLRSVRRHGETTGIVAGASFAELRRRIRRPLPQRTAPDRARAGGVDIGRAVELHPRFHPWVQVL